jgi:ATP-dependent RNA helicase DDX3X
MPKIEDPAVYAERARAGEWIEPQPYDYTSANARDNLEIAWFSKAKKYEWRDEYGEVAPRDEELEIDLFHNTYLSSQGDRMENLTKFTVHVSGPVNIDPVRSVSLLKQPLKYFLMIFSLKMLAFTH